MSKAYMMCPGDCWFVAGAACLAVANRKLFARCVPQDQSFTKDYAGTLIQQTRNMKSYQFYVLLHKKAECKILQAEQL